MPDFTMCKKAEAVAALEVARGKHDHLIDRIDNLQRERDILRTGLREMDAKYRALRQQLTKEDV